VPGHPSKCEMQHSGNPHSMTTRLCIAISLGQQKKLVFQEKSVKSAGWAARGHY
jgi:hypothetical protein